MEEGGAYKFETNTFNSDFHNRPTDRIGLEDADEGIVRQLIGNDVYVHISTGCNHACDFCAIKNAKGGVRSKSIDTIVNDIVTYIQKNKQQNLYQFVLQSDDCGGYGLDIGTNFAELVEGIKKINKNIKLKCSNIHPEDLLRIWPDLKKNITMFSLMNIPLEHGSNRILKLMKRYYVIDDVMEVLDEIRELSPNTWLHNQMIFNYPTETREDFLELVEVCKKYDETIFHGFSEVKGKKVEKLYPKVWHEEKVWRKKYLEKFIAKEIKSGFIVDPNRMLNPSSDKI